MALCSFSDINLITTFFFFISTLHLDKHCFWNIWMCIDFFSQGTGACLPWSESAECFTGAPVADRVFKVSACSTLGVYTLFYKHGFRRVCIIFFKSLISLWCLNYHSEVQLLVKRFIFLLRSWRNHVEHKLQWTENLCTHSSACLWMHVQSTVVFDFCGYNMFYSMTLVLRCNSIHRYITYEALWTIDKIISVMSMVRHCLPSIFDVGICLLSIQHLHPPPSHTPPPGMQVSDPQAF